MELGSHWFHCDSKNTQLIVGSDAPKAEERIQLTMATQLKKAEVLSCVMSLVTNECWLVGMAQKMNRWILERNSNLVVMKSYHLMYLMSNSTSMYQLTFRCQVFDINALLHVRAMIITHNFNFDVKFSYINVLMSKSKHRIKFDIRNFQW